MEDTAETPCFTVVADRKKILDGDLEKMVDGTFAMVRKTFTSGWIHKHFTIYGDGLIEYSDRGAKKAAQIVKIISIEITGVTMQLTALVPAAKNKLEYKNMSFRLRAPDEQQAKRWHTALVQAQQLRRQFNSGDEAEEEEEEEDYVFNVPEDVLKDMLTYLNESDDVWPELRTIPVTPAGVLQALQDGTIDDADYVMKADEAGGAGQTRARLLYFALVGQFLDVVQALVKQGADVNKAVKWTKTPEGIMSISPLGASIEVQNALLVQELLSLEADVHIYAKDGTDEAITPMALCMSYGNKHVETLLDAFDDDIEEGEEETPKKNLDDGDPDMKVLRGIPWQAERVKMLEIQLQFEQANKANEKEKGVKKKKPPDGDKKPKAEAKPKVAKQMSVKLELNEEVFGEMREWLQTTDEVWDDLRAEEGWDPACVLERLTLGKLGNANYVMNCGDSKVRMMYFAVLGEFEQVAIALHSIGADLNIGCKWNSKPNYGDIALSPLGVAIEAKNHKMVKFLLDLKAEVNVCAEDTSSESFDPMALAKRYKYTDCEKALKKAVEKAGDKPKRLLDFDDKEMKIERDKVKTKKPPGAAVEPSGGYPSDFNHLASYNPCMSVELPGDSLKAKALEMKEKRKAAEKGADGDASSPPAKSKEAASKEPKKTTGSKSPVEGEAPKKKKVAGDVPKTKKKEGDVNNTSTAASNHSNVSKKTVDKKETKEPKEAAKDTVPNKE